MSGGLKLGTAQLPIAVHGNQLSALAFGLALNQRQDGLVLDLRCDNRQVSVQKRPQDCLVAFGGPTCEDDLTRQCADQGRDVASSFLDGVSTPSASSMRTACVSPELAEERKHSFPYFGKNRGCGIIVEIHHATTIAVVAVRSKAIESGKRDGPWLQKGCIQRFSTTGGNCMWIASCWAPG